MKQQYIGKLLPIEGYTVVYEGDISSTYFHSLTHLYQPLIGIQAIALYQTLLNESLWSSDWDNPQTHHVLMTYLSLPLDQIYEARLKLEAIGLLDTYQQESEQNKVYVYKLYAPCTPTEFFSNDMLTQLLYHELGSDKCDKLYQAFKLHYPRQHILGDKVSASFREVFTSYSSEEDVSVAKPNTAPNDGPNVDIEAVDYNLMSQMLEQRMLPVEQILSPVNKKLIAQMYALYNLTNQDIEKALLWALSDENSLITDEFKSACLDLYQTRRKQQPNEKVLDRKTSIDGNESKAKKPVTKEEQFIEMLEKISPRQLLEDLSGGNYASTQDLKIVSEVMSQQNLTPGVMNVLIHYVLLKTDMKLTKSYLEKIASHWARKNVTTVRQAMTLAKSEHNKYQQWGTSKQSYYKKPTKKEVIPDWFKDRKQTKQPVKQEKEKQSTSSDVDIDELMKKLRDS
ncbi:DnaD domain protein [Aquibacillus koreensis]|uniref:DnaD domain protein n=1 Tax=Aquibacillus koreensis TaxID=279446 RepID=A0A9X4AGS6_9BACI|nr:DnaD domain protein [Aquibacillus koreensis]MCT2537197.1 DnaD domain protein [Aquibacillus koreensis]MDC3419231.1 DnaD domain protein [Aquibacillus koreensis]